VISNNSQDSDYSSKYVAFLDVLGFGDLVGRGDDDPQMRSIVVDVIGVLRRTLAQNPRVGFRFTHFSDSIVISADCNLYGLHAVFSGCRMVARNLLSRGFLLRGGIVMGNVTHTEELLFGTGMIAAYELDRSGGAPRIILDPSIVAEVASYGADFGLDEQVAADPDDDTPFLHVLLDFEEWDPTPAVGKEVLDGHAAYLARRIAFNTANADWSPGVRAKWAWMRAYWNRSVARRGFLPLADDAAHG
jgi:hypothetical protein